jgi:hypothetical protein
MTGQLVNRQPIISDERQNSLKTAIIISIGLAFAWWIVALLVRASGLATVWYDQGATFTQVGKHILDPYSVRGFVNPPWTAVLLAPFSVMPLEIAVLIQLELYFVLMTLVIFKFGGNLITVLITLVSFFAFDAILELNLDWLVCIGLLLPTPFSGPFLLVRPQEASGYWISFRRREFVQATIFTLAFIVITLFIWRGWPLQMLQAVRTYSLGHFYNLAPAGVLPFPFNLVVIGFGVWLSWRAFRRHDAILAILAWLCFVPYITMYALVIPFGLFAIRYPHLATDISAVMWLVLGVLIVVTVMT